MVLAAPPLLPLQVFLPVELIHIKAALLYIQFTFPALKLILAMTLLRFEATPFDLQRTIHDIRHN